MANFGGSGGDIPEALRGIDSSQQISLLYKFNFLENDSDCNKILQSFRYMPDDNAGNAKRTVNESEIKNTVKDAWKELESLGSKINDFKTNLFKPKTVAKAPLEIGKPKLEQESDCKLNNANF